mmetsp:Transcript_69196/g.218905  ORF Transcript_69196/g.218905 Transcript_69196/m.218905 type:complete len:282 (+) Transcript_69196:1307-2152(+)
MRERSPGRSRARGRRAWTGPRESPGGPSARRSAAPCALAAPARSGRGSPRRRSHRRGQGGCRAGRGGPRPRPNPLASRPRPPWPPPRRASRAASGASSRSSSAPCSWPPLTRRPPTTSPLGRPPPRSCSAPLATRTPRRVNRRRHRPAPSPSFLGAPPPGLRGPPGRRAAPSPARPARVAAATAPGAVAALASAAAAGRRGGQAFAEAGRRWLVAVATPSLAQAGQELARSLQAPCQRRGPGRMPTGESARPMAARTPEEVMGRLGGLQAHLIVTPTPRRW